MNDVSLNFPPEDSLRVYSTRVPSWVRCSETFNVEEICGLTRPQYDLGGVEKALRSPVSTSVLKYLSRSNLRAVFIMDESTVK